MPIKIANTRTITREEWLNIRRTGIGGSDASVLVPGANPWRSPFTLWADKKGMIPDKEDTEIMRQGRDLEDYVARRFAEQENKKVHHVNAMFQSAENPFMIADVDRKIAGENAGLECKTTSVYSKSDFDGGEIPPYYYIQCQHYIATMGFDCMYLAVLVLSKAFYTFRIPRDDSEIAALMKTEKAFYDDYMCGDGTPEIDGSENTAETVKLLRRDDNPEMFVLPGETDDLLDKFMYNKSLIKSYEDENRQIQSQILFQMGDHCSAGTAKYNISNSPVTSTRLDTKKIKAEAPNLYKKYSKESMSYRFTVKGVK